MVELHNADEKTETRYFTWNEWVIYLTVCLTGCIYYICKKLFFKRIQQQFGEGGSSYGTVGILENPVVNSAYKEEDMVLKRRYIRNKLQKMDDQGF